MKTCFVDTNLFVRYLTNDDPAKVDRVERLLCDAAAGTVSLVTADVVLTELVWVLESVYMLTPEEITPMLRAILATPGLNVINGAVVDRALDYYYLDQHIDFVDGYIAATTEKLHITDLYSFDRKHLSNLENMNRLEP